MAASTSNNTANVIIFNKIQNNEKDVELLQKTFEKLKCITREVKNQDYEGLKRIVKNIVTADFKNVKYIVIIVLDNTNENEYIWETTDKRNFHINGDLLTSITQNEDLKGKLRFSIMQTNRFSKDDKIIRRKINPTEQNFFIGKDVKLFATSTGHELKPWKNGDLSPFISILCEEIGRNYNHPLKNILSNIIDKVDKAIEERPSVEMNCRNVSLGFARSY